MPEPIIAAEEVIYRRIQPGSSGLSRQTELTSASFKLKRLENGQFEEGLSVYRGSTVSPAEVLAKPDAKPDSKVAAATAGEVRALTNSEGRALNLDVIAVSDENDPGHAEIRGPEPRKLPSSAPKKLSRLFRTQGDG